MPIPPTDKSTDPNSPMDINPSAIVTDQNPIQPDKIFPSSTDPVQIWSDAEMERKALTAIGKPEWLRRKHLVNAWIKQMIPSKEAQQRMLGQFLMLAATMDSTKWIQIESMPLEMRFFHLSKLLNPEETGEI